MKASIAAAGLGLLVAAAGASAQTGVTPAAIADVVNCRSQTDGQARLACYDAAVGSLAAASSSGALVVVDKEDVKKARRGLFGFSLPKMRFLDGDDNETEQEKVRELASNIQSVGRTGYELWLVTLDEGGTWQTTEAQPHVPLPRSGLPVLVKRGPLGNYMMSINGGRGLRVKRLR